MIDFYAVLREQREAEAATRAVTIAEAARLDALVSGADTEAARIREEAEQRVRDMLAAVERDRAEADRLRRLAGDTGARIEAMDLLLLDAPAPVAAPVAAPPPPQGTAVRPPGGTSRDAPRAPRRGCWGT